MGIEFFNLKEVIDKLERLPDQARPVIKQAFDMGLQKVRDHARGQHAAWPDKIFNPDGTWRYHNITTNLTNSIGLRMRESGDVMEGDVGALNELTHGDAMEYAGKIERDHPFLAPAVEAKKQEWLDGIEDAIRKFLA